MELESLPRLHAATISRVGLSRNSISKVWKVVMDGADAGMAGLGRACENGAGGGLVLIAWNNKALPLSQGFEANCFAE
jgi:hypothetical protein